MGTFWRASIRALTPNAVPNLKIQTSWTPTISCFRPIKIPLMRFNDSQSLSPWPVSEAMADIVTTSLRIGAKTDGAMDMASGAGESVGFRSGTTAGSNSGRNRSLR